MRAKEKTPVIGICGWKGSGKTTLCVRLIEEFSRRGLKVSSIKHTDHDFLVGNENTDSEKHRKAGAYEVALVGETQWAIMHSITKEKNVTLDIVLSKLSNADLIIIEGYKNISFPKIETHRRQQKEKKMLWINDNSIIGIATDHEFLEATIPIYSINSFKQIADFIDLSVGPLHITKVTK